MKLNQGELKTLEQVLKDTKALDAAGQGDKSRCGCFTSPFNGVSKEDQLTVGNEVHTYVSSWIIPLLEAVMRSIAGEATQDDKDLLDFYKRNPWM